jgi:hypothetical protein
MSSTHSSFSPTPVNTLAALTFATLLLIVAVPPITHAASSTPNLTVASEIPSGTAITGYWVDVTTSGGAGVASGFTPAQFTLSPGSYIVSVGDYGGYTFNHWTDGIKTRSHPVTINATGSLALTAVYCPPGGCGGSNIVVHSIYENGTTLNGMYTTLTQNGQTVGTGFTPVTFPTTNGLSYVVTVSDYTNAYFNHWSNGYSVRSISVAANSTTTRLTAEYTPTQQGPPPSNYSITVTSNDLNGTTLHGFYVDLRINGNHVASGFTPVTFKNLQQGIQYGVVVYWYGNYYFRHFSDGDLNRYALVTLNSTSGQNSTSLDGLYQYVPKAQAASLDIEAELPNGTLIGTSSINSGGYIQHTPGMWLDVIPPGSQTPFTGTFTGGSILPFIFFNHDTYTVDMSAGYKNYSFSHWKDTNSTNPDRAITLNGNATYIAIYNYS